MIQVSEIYVETILNKDSIVGCFLLGFFDALQRDNKKLRAINKQTRRANIEYLVFSDAES